jgi:hypothetical protein
MELKGWWDWMKAVAKSLLLLLLFAFAVDSSETDATRVVSAVFFVGIWLDHRLKGLLLLTAMIEDRKEARRTANAQE